VDFIIIIIIIIVIMTTVTRTTTHHQIVTGIKVPEENRLQNMNFPMKIM